MSDDQETKPAETPKEEPKKEEEDTVKEEESTATFEPVVSNFFGGEKLDFCSENCREADQNPDDHQLMIGRHRLLIIGIELWG